MDGPIPYRRARAWYSAAALGRLRASKRINIMHTTRYVGVQRNSTGDRVMEEFRETVQGTVLCRG